MMKLIKSIAEYLLIAVVAGVLVPYFFALCLFGTTLQTFIQGVQPTPGYWSGAPTGAPTAVPSAVQVWTEGTLSSANGAFLVVWSFAGALVGEGFARWRWGNDWHAGRKIWLGALVGSFLFIGITLFGFLR